MLIIFFDAKGIVHKEFVLVGQSILHTIATFYINCVKMYKDFDPNFGEKQLAAALRQCTVSHFLFRLGICYQKQHYCRPPPTLIA
jgi:hypothetical protein